MHILLFFCVKFSLIHSIISLTTNCAVSSCGSCPTMTPMSVFSLSNVNEFNKNIFSRLSIIVSQLFTSRD